MDSQINIIINTLKKGFGDKDAKSAFKELNAGFQSVTGLSLSYAGALTAAIAIGKKFIDFQKEAATAASNEAASNATLESILKSTNNAVGMSAQELEDLATAHSKETGIMEDNVKAAEAVMLTFTQIGRNVFPEAMEAAENLSAVLGSDLTSTTTMVSKLLNVQAGDVSAVSTAMSAAKRVGVSFSSQQIQMAKDLISAGDTMKYQQLILKELNTEYGNSARAMSSVDDGLEELAAAKERYMAAVGKKSLAFEQVWNKFWTDYYNNSADSLNANERFSESIKNLGIAAVDTYNEAGLAVTKYYQKGRELTYDQVKYLVILQNSIEDTAAVQEAYNKLQEKSQDSTNSYSLTLLSEADALQVVKAAVAGTLKTALNTYNDTMDDLYKTNADLNKTILYQEDIYKRAPAMIDSLTQALKDNEAAQAESGHTAGSLVDKHKELEEELQKWKDALEASPGAIQGLNNSLDENIAKQSEAEEAYRKATAQLIYQQVSAKLDADASLELARTLGLVSDKDYQVSKSILELTEKYDANADGVIDADEANQGYIDSLKEIYDQATAIYSLPDQKTIELYIETHSGQYVPATASTMGIINSYSSSGSGKQAANGGTYTGVVDSGTGKYQVLDPDGGYSYTTTAPHSLGGEFGAYETIRVGEKGPETVTFDQSGYVTPNGGGFGGNIVVNVYGSGDPKVTAREAVRILKQEIKLQGGW